MKRFLPWFLLAFTAAILAVLAWPFMHPGSPATPPPSGRVVIALDDSTRGWRILVDGSPYIVKAMAYGVTRIGQSPVDGTQTDWMKDDFDGDGRIDGPYNSWIDLDNDNVRDESERAIGDFTLLKEMGCNTIRTYHHPSNVPLLRELFRGYGIRAIIGDFVGMYGFRGQLPPVPGDNFTDYRDTARREAILAGVKELVMTHKDEPYVLMWMLGNENNYNVGCNASQYPEIYFSFMNRLAQEIKALDPNHPVGICLGEMSPAQQRLVAKYCPDVDIYGVNTYRGDRGFTGLWRDLRKNVNKPVLVTEFGCSSFSERGMGVGESYQARYIAESWHDIAQNACGGPGQGNAIGGVVFEWNDEWWKTGVDAPDGNTYPTDRHDTAKLGPGPFIDGYGYSEWFGVTGQGDGSQSPFLRQLRRAYFVLRRLWNEGNPAPSHSVGEPAGIAEEAMGRETRSTPLFTLALPGDPVVDYGRFGSFTGEGTSGYRFEIADRDGLARAVGEGIYPNELDVENDPSYQAYLRAGRLEGTKWQFVNTADPAAEFYKWTTTAEMPATKLFYAALALERAGLYAHAVKSCYAILVHFPGSGIHAADQKSVWYVGPVALDMIHDICRRHPELGLRLDGASIEIESFGDTDFSNDVVVASPGRLVRAAR